MSFSRVLLAVASLFLSGCSQLSANAAYAEEANTSNSAVSSWGARLNPSGDLPKSGFRAAYFDRKNLNRPPIAETVDSIAIKYSWANFHNIASPNFAGYWVGRLNFRETTLKQITVSQSWAKTRILIDGEVVFEGGKSKAFTHEFGWGSHIIEVEYINNWHTTEFKVTIGDVMHEMSMEDVSSYLRSEAPKGALLNYVGIYESDSPDTQVNLMLLRSGKPVILWLASYEAVDWHISATDRVAAVVMSSNKPGSRVSGISTKHVLRVRGGPRQYSEVIRCGCSGGGVFHCENRDDLVAIASQLQEITGLALYGYAMKYSASDLEIMRLDESVIQRVSDARSRNEEMQRACSAHANPDFDRMFDQ